MLDKLLASVIELFHERNKEYPKPVRSYGLGIF